MKKFILPIIILILILGFSFIYFNYKEEITITKKIEKLNIEEEVIDIDKVVIYGTHFNIHSSYIVNDKMDLVLYNGEFKNITINKTDNGFNLSDNINEGLYLDNIDIGDYYLFIREEINDEENNISYKYYSLNNNTEYKETTYYPMSYYNKKIVIDDEDSYPTMMIRVKKYKNNNDIYDIVLDPGHGGMDGGAAYYGYKESDLTMDLSLKVKEILEDFGLKVKLTHEKDQLTTNEKLNEYGKNGRAVIPHEVNAKYLISMHFNSSLDSNVHGLEVYTAKNINYDFAKIFVNNITELTGLSCSINKINRIEDGIYTRNFTELEIEKAKQSKEQNELYSYDITTNSNYYYIIRETGGILTGAYVDNRNESNGIDGNDYYNSNVGIEAYLLELGYLSNKNDLDNINNNIDTYAEAIANTIKLLGEKEQVTLN